MKCDTCKKDFNRTEIIYRVKAKTQPVYIGLYAYPITPHMLYVCEICKCKMIKDEKYKKEREGKMRPHRGLWKSKTKKTGTTIQIKKKGDLKIILRNEGYNRIAIWADGIWVDVGAGYGGEQSGDNPVIYIQRSFHYDLTWKEISELITKKEDELNRL